MHFSTPSIANVHTSNDIVRFPLHKPANLQKSNTLTLDQANWYQSWIVRLAEWIKTCTTNCGVQDFSAQNQLFAKRKRSKPVHFLLSAGKLSAGKLTAGAVTVTVSVVTLALALTLAAADWVGLIRLP